MTNISKLYQQLEEGKVSKEYFTKVARREYGEYVSPTNSYNDIVNILKSKRLIEVSHKLSTSQIIDRLNPYAVKKGIEVEMSKAKGHIDLEKIKQKVAKKLMANHKAYEVDQFPNAVDVEKRDSKQEMKVVKSDLKDKDNAMKKPKGFHADKANTKSSKKENRKGTPKGVKVMKEDMGGSQIPQPANYTNKEVMVMLDPNTKKPLSSPKKAIVKKQQGNILYVDFGDGQEVPVTISVIKTDNDIQQMDKSDLDKSWAKWDKDEMGRVFEKEEDTESMRLKEIVGKLKSYLAKKKKMKQEALYKRIPKPGSKEEDDKPVSINPSDPDDKKLLNDPDFRKLYKKQQ